ncbi:MAG: hypothetical protein KAQ94_02490 [Arcobacteraceae bacterium]|nr:hypothetical protein [Arcobacteraceae bacterium]
MNKKSYDSLYPDILFHFTTKDALLSILESEFTVTYAREKIEGKETTREFAIPMVSFCDLKLSELKVHMEKYGKYGIGLTKEWANRQGLNPVMYVNKYCEFTDNFNNALYKVYPDLSKLRKNKNIIPIQYFQILDAYRYMKNYEGTLIRENEIFKNFRFADEREWRYVPSLNNKDVEYPFVAKNNIKYKKQKDEYNNKIANIKLTFQPTDIKYLIVENENEIISLINHIKDVKGKFNQKTIDILSSRILTKDQIDNDI